MAKQPNPINNITLSLLILVVGLAAFYFISKGLISTKSQTQSEQKDSASRKEDRVDQHYRSLYMKKMREEMQIDNERFRHEAKQGIPQRWQGPNVRSPNWPGIDAAQEQGSRFEEDRRQSEYDVTTPEDYVQNEIRLRQEQDYDNYRMQQEFIRQLKENARRDGYELRIDKDLRAYPVRPNPQ